MTRSIQNRDGVSRRFEVTFIISRFFAAYSVELGASGEQLCASVVRL